MSISYILKTCALVLTSAVFGFALRADAGTHESNSVSEWAGEYWFDLPNSTMAMQLVITPDSRFTLTDIGCFGNSEINHGSVSFEDGVLLLNPRPWDQPLFGIGSNAMVPVHWRDKLYLVQANRVGDFAEAIKTEAVNCRDHCQGFFVREGDLPNCN
jgi:hypothetical protein